MKEQKNLLTKEIQDLLAKIAEYKQIIADAEGALDAAIGDLEEALEEVGEREQI